MKVWKIEEKQRNLLGSMYYEPFKLNYKFDILLMTLIIVLSIFILIG